MATIHPTPPKELLRSTKKKQPHRVTVDTGCPQLQKNGSNQVKQVKNRTVNFDQPSNVAHHGKRRHTMDSFTPASQSSEENEGKPKPKFSSHILTEDEIEHCRAAFFIIAKGGEVIDVWDIGSVFKSMDESLMKKDLMQMMSEVMEIGKGIEVDNVSSGRRLSFSDTNSSKSHTVNFTVFLQVVHNYRQRYLSVDDDADADMISAYIACGGPEDTSGHIERERLVQIIKYDFGMSIDLDALIDEVDLDGNGEIEYDEFKALLSHCMAADKV